MRGIPCYIKLIPDAPIDREGLVKKSAEAEFTGTSSFQQTVTI